MEWFLIDIPYAGEINDHISSIRNLLKEEFGLEVFESKKDLDDYKVVYASNVEEIPLQINDQHIVVIGDIILHNKHELLKEYNVDNLSNEQVITLLYKRCGMDFLNKIHGEFSFVLYDKVKKQLYAVRDHLGIKTLYWMKYKNRYIFSSDIFLMKEYFNIQSLNLDYFMQFYERNGMVDFEATPYMQVNRLPSGCYVNISEKSTKIHCYWDLSFIKEKIDYSNQLTYFEEFRELLGAAVSNRLADGNVNSVMLSGGLDSTSVYALCKSSGGFVKPVSAVFNELKDSDEQEYINELLSSYNDKGIYINFDNLLMFQDFPSNVPFSYEPSVNSISFEFTFNIVKTAAEHGLTNILSGFAADHLLTGSLFVTRDFLREFKIGKTLKYITEYSISTNTSAMQNLLNYTLLPDVLIECDINHQSDYGKLMKKKFKQIDSYFKRELYFQITNAKSHIYSDRLISALTGVDLKHPFLDRKLVEFIYKIPGEYLFNEQQTKYILRESMKEYLPSSIVNRLNKTTHLAYTYKSMQQNWHHIYRVMKHPKNILSLGLVTESEWVDQFQKWRNGVEVKNKFWVLFSIELWFILYNQKFQ